MKIMADVSLDEDGSLVLVIKNPKRLFETKDLEKPKSQANEIIAHYCDAYAVRYKTPPVITGKTAGIAKAIAKSLELGRAKELISHYLTMNEFYFVQRRHDLAVFENSINAVNLSFKTGLLVTSKSARAKEETDVSVNAARSWLEHEDT